MRAIARFDGQCAMDDAITVMVSPAWRGELRQIGADQGLVIVSGGAGALTQRGTGARLCEVLNGYALSTMCLSAMTPPNRRHRDGSGDWLEGFDGALHWLESHQAARSGTIGLLGEDAAAIAALRAAAECDGRLGALVACSGHVEQAGAALGRVHVATLLLVGGLESDMLEAQRDALSRLRGPSRLEAIPGATRRFTEPGAFDTVAHLAGSWLRNHLDAAHRH